MRQGDQRSTAVKDRSIPTWLVVGTLGRGSQSLAATSTWAAPEIAPPPFSVSTALHRAWLAWLELDYTSCHQLLSPVRDSLSHGWLPEPSIDGKRSWAWLRLTALLPSARRGDRLAAVSSLELLHACEKHHPLQEELVGIVFRDFDPDGPAQREWAAFGARLCLTIGHEEALASLTSGEKAALRSAWRAVFRRVISPESRSTIDYVNDLRRDFRGSTGSIHERIDNGKQAARCLTQAQKSLSPYLGDTESHLLHAICSALGEYLALSGKATISTTVAESIEACEEQLHDVSRSGSLLLQETAGPILYEVIRDLSKLGDQLADASRPEVSISLVTNRLPLSASINSVVQCQVMVANDGNVDATEVCIGLEGDGLLFPETWTRERLSPGGQVEATFEALVGQPQRTESILATITYSDTLRHKFEGLAQFTIEDQRPSSWLQGDVNPFTLKVVTKSSNLIGREEELNALISTLAAGSSVSLTGQKRVGKSSIVQSMLSDAREQGWMTAYLPLGRAVTNEGLPGDFVYALLRRISKAVEEALPHVRTPVLDRESTRSSFPIVGGEWITDLGAVLRDSSRLVVAIDDFDELPRQLREGDDASSLFLFLRSLIDEPWLGLVFVGSEVLPTIIANQAHKLNQVVPQVVNGFRSRALTGELLRRLSGHRMDWDESAVDLIHHLSSGIPYYTRQVSSEVWKALKQRDRTYAQRSDVEAAAEHLARNSEIGHYMHLWADDPQGMSLKERRSVVASAVLRAVAECSGKGLGVARSEEVVHVAQEWVQTATQQELGEALQRLLARGVLVEGAGPHTVELQVRLASLWLLEAGGRAIERHYAETYHSHERARVITDRELVDLSSGLTYCGEHISDTRIRAWLEQFGDGEHRRLAFLLMRRLISEGFLKPERFPGATADLKREVIRGEAGRYQQLGRFNRLTNFYLIEHGLTASSSHAVLSDYAKQFKISKTTNVISPDAFADRVSKSSDGRTHVALVLDDFAGTGRQLQLAADGLVETLDRGQDPLWREKTVIVVGAAFSATPLDWSRDGVSGYAVQGQVISNRLRAFHSDAEIFEGREEIDKAKDLMRTIGGGLVRNDPLGFGDTALLVSMHNNCPNNTLPVFWSKGTFAGRSWLPLFERR